MTVNSMDRDRVNIWSEEIIIPTYVPEAPDKNPMFLERRVYQGSTGSVYPLPFIDRISETKTDRTWQVVWLENKYLKVMILPEIGGRIHSILDKTTGYEALYKQDTIKPALVGLAGPWISGGIEFNWPQHHRPATFMSVDYQIEQHDDGSATVWLSDHDPLHRMKGMHGVCLHPDLAFLELKVRLYNRTPFTQNFLWWANMGVRVDDHYQSIFPPDVQWVADHAKRAVSDFPSCTTSYYGVDYSPATRLDWFKNIPVPTSYMAIATEFDFVGGYDHSQRAGLIHVANHHISPGKKQWTWGNSDFGNRWYKHLAEDGGRYIEIMAGVYTENQPDFSYLEPGETKSFSQFWYPISEIGVPVSADKDIALSTKLNDGALQIGLFSTANYDSATITVYDHDNVIESKSINLAAGKFASTSFNVPAESIQKNLRVLVSKSEVGEISQYECAAGATEQEPLVPATEPGAPETISSSDELFLTGLHIQQYLHPTRSPEPYWLEALSRDPGDSRCNNALGLRRLRTGRFVEAISYFRTSIARLTIRNPNPPDGEAFYNLGLALRYTSSLPEAYDAFYKATWNAGISSASYFELAQIDCVNSDWREALDHLDRSLRTNQDNLKARNLRVMVLKNLARADDAIRELDFVLALDKLDWWSRYLAGMSLTSDTQTRIDLALDLGRAGFFDDGVKVLHDAMPNAEPGTVPLLHYHAAYLLNLADAAFESAQELEKAAAAESDYCFPFRLEDLIVLEWAVNISPQDARSPYYLGNLLYSYRRHDEAIGRWEQSVQLDPNNPVAWRNLGIAYFNVKHNESVARDAYKKAFMLAPGDARLCYERDQLAKRLGDRLSSRIDELERFRHLVDMRDDLSLELCSLYNQTNRPTKAREILDKRVFQPWEGGEGQALRQHVVSCLKLGKKFLKLGEPSVALTWFDSALAAPDNIGEASHPLANRSEIYYWIGVAYEASGKRLEAEKNWSAAASFTGDFQQMEVKAYSEHTYYQALSLKKLDRENEAKTLLNDMLVYSKDLAKSEAKIDYFATSLPTMLLFEDDITNTQQQTAKLISAYAYCGLEDYSTAAELLDEILTANPANELASDLKETIGSTRNVEQQSITI
jgi:tetratricopeptide (TPR) repeat protein